MNDRGLKVLEQYDLEIISTRRGRGSYLCETNQGLKLLCDFEGSEKKMAFQNRIFQRLKENGYKNVDTALETKEGKLVSVDRDENRYVLKDWYAGRECSASSERDILDSVANLARLHQCMKFPGEPREYQGIGLTQELERKNREMRKVRAFMRKREPKHPFEQLFLSSFSVFYEQASYAQEAVRAGEFDAVQKKQVEEGMVCHGEYNYHHVLFLDSGMATTGFEKCRFDDQVVDLYQFMRKILEKQDWDIRLGLRMLECYERIRPLSTAERKILHLRMVYPEKFWKLANHYCGSRKAWIPGRYQQKLELLNRQLGQRNNFLKILE
ncbi:MAG: CotS family spore coat protein [Lachnospiraceae bacterium]|nr:CotS family spore coat protein [Lachnospiraceae bacterium]